jgi:hypothetical protein
MPCTNPLFTPAVAIGIMANIDVRRIADITMVYRGLTASFALIICLHLGKYMVHFYIYLLPLTVKILP